MITTWSYLLLLSTFCLATDSDVTKSSKKTLNSTEIDDKHEESAVVNNSEKLLNSTEDTAEKIPEQIVKGKKTPIEIYQNLFKLKRKDHIHALESLLMMDNVEKQHKMIGIMMKTIVKTISHGKEVLLKAEYKAGDPFPDKTNVKDGLSMVLENTALFTDLVVRFPFVTEIELKNNRESWTETMKWAKDVCEKSGVYVGKHSEILRSLGQEMGLDDRDPDYKNPFRVKPAIDPITSEERLKLYEERKRKERLAAKKKKKKTKKKGPKLSKTEL